MLGFGRDRTAYRGETNVKCVERIVMTPLELFFYVVLPLTVGVVGVVYGETFRARASRSDRVETVAVEGESIFPSEATYRTIHLMDLVTARAFRDALKDFSAGIIAPTIQQPRDWKDEMYLRHGNIQLRTLRRLYGQGFASGFPDYFTLGDILRRLDAQTLEELRKDFASGKLDEIARAD
jgi:hypothetical protein